ncbi:cupin domain-containing protein [Rubrivivax sp. A210]|uniref:cupin domain-containing protein n=1 Tax=Rubrivivax sp. A210 TaxID=2772301 RepID=UPI00191A3D7E|nr:cupin domain-containing protein [Rubrivivax sp. A210]
MDEQAPLAPLTMLGGLTPAAFMRRHWQKKPLLVRQAWPGVKPPLPRSALFALAASDDVESRLVERQGGKWRVRHGPLQRRMLPPLAQPDWTLLVQGLDLHVPAASAMRERFRFVPDARLDDLMASWASPGGGVGPHVDSYDVFLIQVHGRRRWRVAPPGDTAFVDGLPLKILRQFEPTLDWVLEPGDMLYLPPLWGHDGVAEGGDCITCSVGFRAPAADELARELLQRVADEDDAGPGKLYRDPRQAATATPGAIPEGLVDFARRAVEQHLADPQWLKRALGEVLSEPKPRVWFRSGVARRAGVALSLDPCTRMMYDEHHVFINGEAFRAGGRDAQLMRRLADARHLAPAEWRRLGTGALALVDDWLAAGWLRQVEA